METCSDCGRSKQGDWCGYCWGLAAGVTYHEGGIDAVRRMSEGKKSGGGCVLVLFSGAAIPVALEVVQRLT
ncbi:hypothetical protein GCM10010406_04660 [Streptomyces thermolineatus]|uniref:Uncharacterized protein n=1 Tax=Streptomyces thermolineatus TaxID=44033 RepID=A0ABN3KU88_9ACTN